MVTKQLTIRIPMDFHRQLVKYAEEHYLPVSRVITQSVTKTIIYKPRPATFRSAGPVVPQHFIQPLETDEFGLSPCEDDDLQRRAAAPLKGV